MKKNNKGNTGKVIGGALIGAAIGVAIGIFTTSKAGKKAGKAIKDKSTEFYKYLQPKIKKAKEMGEAEYKAFVANAAESYSKNKKLSKAEATHLLKEAKASWAHLKKNL